MKTTIQRISLILLILGFSFTISAQEMEVSGKVYNASDKQPLIGVSVIIKGTNKSVVTDVNGFYKITASKGQTLVFSFVGRRPL